MNKDKNGDNYQLNCEIVLHYCCAIQYYDAMYYHSVNSVT